MPGSVANAAPSTVLPNSLCRAFVHTREYPVIDNEYRNGESQRSAQAATSRKKWALTKRLTPSQLATLRSFYDARNGIHEPFHFYDPYDTNPKFSGTGPARRSPAGTPSDSTPTPFLALAPQCQLAGEFEHAHIGRDLALLNVEQHGRRIARWLRFHN